MTTFSSCWVSNSAQNSLVNQIKTNNCCIVGQNIIKFVKVWKISRKQFSTKKWSEKFDLLISRGGNKTGCAFFRSSSDRILWEILPMRAKSNLSLIIFYNLEEANDFIEGNLRLTSDSLNTLIYFSYRIKDTKKVFDCTVSRNTSRLTI